MPTPRRVRVIHNHTFIVDTVKAVHVWEHDAYPHFYVPETELKNCALSDKTQVRGDEHDVSAAVCELTVSAHDGLAEAKTDRVLRFTKDSKIRELAGMVRLEFGSMGK